MGDINLGLISMLWMSPFSCRAQIWHGFTIQTFLLLERCEFHLKDPRIADKKQRIHFKQQHVWPMHPCVQSNNCFGALTLFNVSLNFSKNASQSARLEPPASIIDVETLALTHTFFLFFFLSWRPKAGGKFWCLCVTSRPPIGSLSWCWRQEIFPKWTLLAFQVLPLYILKS